MCFFCLTSLPEVDTGFCPSCGSVLLQHSLVSTTTTASYDPMSKDYKPWREKPLLKRRNYKFFEGKLKPWFPASQPRPPKLVKPVKILPFSARTEESAARNHAEDRADEGKPAEFNGIDPPSIKDELIAESDTEVVSAFTSTADSGILREEIMSDVSTEPQSDSMEMELRSKCFPVVSLANAAAAISCASSEWLDLEKIDGDQFCVTQHLQKSLEYMKAKVVHKFQYRLCPSIILESDIFVQLQWYWDEMGKDVESGLVCWKAYAADLFVEEKHLTWTTLSYSNNPENTKTLKMMLKNDYYSVKLQDFDKHVVFDECLMVDYGRVRITRTTPIRYLPVQIRSYLEYRTQLDGSNIHHMSAKMSKREFCRTAVPTHVRVVLYPSQVQTVLNLHWSSVPILSLTISSAGLDMMLSETKVLEKITSTSEDSKQRWSHLIHRILTYLRLEYSAEQLFYSIIGSFSDPVRESAVWPEDVINESTIDEEEDCNF
eukprot:gene36990-44878_t